MCKYTPHMFKKDIYCFLQPHKFCIPFFFLQIHSGWTFNIEFVHCSFCILHWYGFLSFSLHDFNLDKLITTSSLPYFPFLCLLRSLEWFTGKQMQKFSVQQKVSSLDFFIVYLVLLNSKESWFDIHHFTALQRPSIALTFCLILLILMHYLYQCGDRDCTFSSFFDMVPCHQYDYAEPGLGWGFGGLA